MKKLLLIDGNAIVARCMSVISPNISDYMNVATSHLFFQMYVSIAKKYSDAHSIIAWDSGYEYRMKLSQSAVDEGIIEKTYKQDRREKRNAESEYCPEMDAIKKEQRKTLSNILNYTNIQQVTIGENEADDVIASYCKKYKGEYFIVIVTGDKDFYQLLDDNVMIYNLTTKSEYTKDLFVAQYGIQPQQWIDMGALCGDNGDTIIGVDGVGEKTALKFLKDYGSIENVIKCLSEKSDKNSREKAVVDSEKKIRVAYKLKKMIDGIDIPQIEIKNNDTYMLEKVLEDYKLYTLKSKIEYLSSKRDDSNLIFSSQVMLNNFKCKICGTEYSSKDVSVHCDKCNVDIVKEKKEVFEQMELGL